MMPAEQEFHFVEGDFDSVSSTHSFSHEAMVTTFQIVILHDDARYARQAARAAFDELDRLEADFSRFVENSDIARINNLTANQSVSVGLETFECLQIAAQIYDKTGGAFDITVGSLWHCWLNEDKTLRTPSDTELNLARRRTGMHLLQLDEDGYTVRLLADSVQVDLGGIGKGYAIDKMTDLLREWGIDIAILHGGYSSVLALAPPPGTKGWPVTLTNPVDTSQTLAHLPLQNRAFGGSGLQQGWHIIDPRAARPVAGRITAWACATDAATADALSTAFMIMTPNEVSDYCLHHPDTLAMIVIEEAGEQAQQEKILRYGHWKENDSFNE
ncbi:MAG: FAD:protein FMN transferase [Planctomycetota bacterium]|jgi:thiamine biosynthesis lipoprotein